MFWRKRKPSTVARPPGAIAFMESSSRFMDESGIFLNFKHIFSEAAIEEQFDHASNLILAYGLKINELIQVRDYNKMLELEQELSFIGHSIIYACIEIEEEATKRHLDDKFIHVSARLMEVSVLVLKARSIPINIDGIE